ncbi:MAG: LysM peptidoglycan-binding domain-containing protein, partial [Candidatus Competibacteraceae bacterium]|nr:LysM peptidoglycan-binding domain-containing protein [Candidatus Competibacteraceae bacterium]
AYGQDWRYTVRPGDTLWSVGERYLRSVAFVPRLQTFNGIADAYRLAPGKRLRIPVSWLRTEPVSAIAQAVSGDAIILPAGGGQQRTLVSGDPLQSGDTVRTRADANVVLQFIDGSEFIVRQN